MTLKLEESISLRLTKITTYPVSNFLFPDLHALHDSGVTKKVMAIIRENLPVGCLDRIVSSYSSKLTRRGSITELCSYRNLSLRCMWLLGSCIGTSLDSYLDKSFIVRGLHGGKAHADFTDMDVDIKVLQLECLGTHTALLVRNS
jgi:hypothetical protein